MEKEIVTTENKENQGDLLDGDFVRCVVPLANVRSSEKGFEIEIELPGISPQDVDINLEGEHLKVSALRPAVEHVGYNGPSIPPTKYARSFRLRSAELDRDGITANTSNGMLKVFIPKTPGLQAKKINISNN